MKSPHPEWYAQAMPSAGTWDGEGAALPPLRELARSLPYEDQLARPVDPWAACGQMSYGLGARAAPAVGDPAPPPPTLGSLGMPPPPAGVTCSTPFIHEWREQWNW